MSSTNFLSGLASNFDWGTLINQLMTAEHKKVDVVTQNQAQQQNALTAWQSATSKLTTFQTALSALRDVSDYNKFKINATSSSATYAASDLVSVSADDTAQPGNHVIQMDSGSQLAQARQVSSGSFSSASNPLGLAGEFVVNGRAVKVEASDSLADIADRVNALNSGGQATHVTASLLAAGSTDYRLILTADDTGADAFRLQEAGSSNVLLRSGGLGFYESYNNTISHATSDGAESDQLSSATVSVKSLLGLTAPPGQATVQVGGHDVTIDLSSDSETLTSIASKINTALGASGSASVVPETKDGVTTYRIDINGTTTFSDSNNVLQALGVVTGTQVSVAKSLSTANALTTQSSGGTTQVSAATAFNDISGYTAGSNDTITISGHTRNGTALTPTTFNTYSGGAYRTVGDLLTAIQDAYAAAGTTVTASVAGGKIKVVDATTGSSQMELNLVANNEGGGGLNLGAVNVDTQGYDQQTAVGRDAVVKVDGVFVKNSSNTISNAVPGLTIDLLQMESGTTINVGVARDYNTVQSSVQGVVGAYNDIISFVNDQFKYDDDKKTAGVLAGDATLRDIKNSLQSAVANEIPGLPNGSNALSLIGVQSDSTGILSINASDFAAAARNDFNAFRRVLGVEGTSTDADITYVSYSNNTQPGTYDVNITQAASNAAVTGSKDLSSGIGASAQQIRITDVSTGRQATISLDPAGNGASTSALVNALNSEMQAVHSQVIVGSVSNTKASDATALSATTTWNNITGASLQPFDTITWTGTDRAGNEVNGNYQITNVTTDTVQGLLSAIETSYGGNATARIDGSGRLVLQDTRSGGSNLSINLTTPAGRGLDFGSVGVTEGAGDGSSQGRDAMDVTASDDGSGHLVLTHSSYGSSDGFKVEQVADPAGANEAVLLSGTANTTASSGGTAAVSNATSLSDIFGYTASTTDTITISGQGHDGSAIPQATFDVYSGGAYKTVGDLLSAIEGAYSAAGFTVTAALENGKIKLTDGTTGLSGLALNLTPNTTNPGLSFGSLGSAATGLANGSTLGKDVAGTINGEAATGHGQLLTGAAPAYGANNSVEGLCLNVNLTPAQLAAQGSSQGTVTLTTGAMENLWRIMDAMTNTGGAVTIRTEGIQGRIDEMTDNIAQMEARLTQRRDQLTAQYTAMEQALSHYKNLSSWLTAQSA
jgi:flagellar hook-associated protein 2